MGVEPIGSGNSHHFYKMEKKFGIEVPMMGDTARTKSTNASKRDAQINIAAAAGGVLRHLSNYLLINFANMV